MAAEAAWVITTVIAAADKAIRIDIVETPKGKKGNNLSLLIVEYIGKGTPESAVKLNESNSKNGGCKLFI